MKGKKAQFYPFFLAMFTVATLVFAYVAISGSKEIFDINGEKAYLGSKQSQVFHTLQDAEEIKSFIQSAATLSAQESFEEMKASCVLPQTSLNQSSEESCGTYIYPLWSTHEKLCAPECQITLKGKFEQKLNKEISKLEFATNSSLPNDFEYSYTEEENGFLLTGKSKQPAVLYSYASKERLSGEKSQNDLSDDGRKLREFIENEHEPISNRAGFYAKQDIEKYEPLFTSIYSFTPSFSVKVNKKIDSPKSVSDFATSVWNECTTDYHSCLKKKIDEYNLLNEPYNIGFARTCEANSETKQFLDIVEQMEDCMAGPYNGFACIINLTSMTNDRDLEIIIHGNLIEMSGVENQNGFESIQKIEGASYTLNNGYFAKDSLPFKKIRFNFDGENQLENIEISGSENKSLLLQKNNFDSSSVTEILSSNELKKDLIIVVSSKENNLANAILVSSYNGIFFNPPKEAFRLCAKVADLKSTPELFDLKFSLKMKKAEVGVCENVDFESFAQNQGPDEMVDSIAQFKGFNLAQILSSIPIPAINLIGVSIGVTDVMSNIPDQSDSNIRVALSNVPDNVVGYKVYCSDSSFPFQQEITGQNSPQSFIYLKNKVKELDVNARRANPYYSDNPYYRAAKLDKCQVPIADARGKITNVVSQAANEIDNAVSITINGCSGSGIYMDKLLKKEYCVTLIPVDSEGNELPACKLTSCTEFNSLFDITIKKLLESQLSSATLIPTNLIPTELKPYIKTVTSKDLIDAASGKRSFDFSDVIDTEMITSDISSVLNLRQLQDINRELIGESFKDILDSLQEASKDAILSEISSSIPDSEASRIIDEMVTGGLSSQEVQDGIMSFATGYIKDEDAKEALQKVITSEDPTSAAMQELKKVAFEEFEKAIIEQKKKILSEAAQSSGGQFVREKIKNAANGCAGNNPSPEDALECISEQKLNSIFKESMSDSSSKIITQIQTVESSSESARRILSEVTSSGTLNDEARQILAQEVAKLSEDEKAAVIREVLTGKTSIAGAIQDEIAKTLPGSEYFNQLMRNPNVKALVEDTLKEELQKQIGIFTSAVCEEE